MAAAESDLNLSHTSLTPLNIALNKKFTSITDIGKYGNMVYCGIKT